MAASPTVDERDDSSLQAGMGNFNRFKKVERNHSLKVTTQNKEKDKNKDKEIKDDKKKDLFSKKRVTKYLDKLDIRKNYEKYQTDCQNSGQDFNQSCYELRVLNTYLGKHKKNIIEDRRKCESGDAKSCSTLRWDGDKKDQAFARAMTKKLRERNDAKACQVYGRTFESDAYDRKSKKKYQRL